jgi:lipopolysaccharide/colanic/teichoic acid biosynthesis glycosyltransferase
MDAEDLVDYPASKRLLDKVVAVLLLLLLSPLVAVVLAAMALDALLVPADRGGFLYRETRISRGREFGLLKFRTLRRAAVRTQAGGEAHARLLEADAQNLTWAGRRILKPWYLDEIPQLLNVLRGEMSLVGPRPWPPSLVEQQVGSGLDYRNRITAGWTGPAQVRKDVTAPESYAELDLQYVEACRTFSSGRLVRLDVSLLWQTVRLLARGEGLRF